MPAVVLEGYKSGKLAYVAGHYYIFRNGRKEVDPRPLSRFDTEKVLWGECPHPWGIRIETESQPFPVLAVFTP